MSDKRETLAAWFCARFYDCYEDEQVSCAHGPDGPARDADALTSDWLTAHDERVRAQEREAVLDEVERLERLIRSAIQAHRDLHTTYANTTACGGGIGGQAITQHCGVTCAYDERHEADNERWHEVERAYFRREEGDPEWDRALRTQDGEQ